MSFTALPRVIPCLLLKEGGLVKGKRFKNHVYVGDPMNAIKIYNAMEVDELFFLDIEATRRGREPDISLIERLAEECYMPFGVGGGIYNIQQIRAVIYAGAEKVVLNTAVAKDFLLLKKASLQFGSQALVVSLDVRKSFFGKYRRRSHCGEKPCGENPVEFAKRAEDAGAGEILLTSIDHEGMMLGYDLDLIAEVTRAVNIPVIASGGAGELRHFKEAIQRGASAVAAGSFFVYHNRNRAVLINYPDREQLNTLLEVP